MLHVRPVFLSLSPVSCFAEDSVSHSRRATTSLVSCVRSVVFCLSWQWSTETWDTMGYVAASVRSVVVDLFCPERILTSDSVHFVGP